VTDIFAARRAQIVEPAAAVRYQIVDRQTGQVVKEFNNKTRARNTRDKMDNDYGAYRYLVRVAPTSGGTRIADPIPLE
jgi:hypothetical protein